MIFIYVCSLARLISVTQCEPQRVDLNFHHLFFYLFIVDFHRDNVSSSWFWIYKVGLIFMLQTWKVCPALFGVLCRWNSWVHAEELVTANLHYFYVKLAKLKLFSMAKSTNLVMTKWKSLLQHNSLPFMKMDQQRFLFCRTGPCQHMVTRKHHIFITVSIWLVLAYSPITLIGYCSSRRHFGVKNTVDSISYVWNFGQLPTQARLC